MRKAAWVYPGYLYIAPQTQTKTVCTPWGLVCVGIVSVGVACVWAWSVWAPPTLVEEEGLQALRRLLLLLPLELQLLLPLRLLVPSGPLLVLLQHTHVT